MLSGTVVDNLLSTGVPTQKYQPRMDEISVAPGFNAGATVIAIKRAGEIVIRYACVDPARNMHTLRVSA